jgi:DNA repair exonuclease SbcCD ATPase subunit
MVVVVFLGSLAFLGFSIAAVFGGPNWASEMRELEGKEPHQGFVFNRSETTPVKWSVKRTGSDQQISSSTVAGDVVGAAYKSLTQAQQAELGALKEQEAQFKERKDAYIASLPQDQAALDARRAQLTAMLAQTREAGSELAKKVAQKTEEAQKIEQRIAERRDDVIRLKTQLDELRADHYRLDELRTELNDQLQQLVSLLDRAEERNQQLKSTSTVK